MKNLIFTKGDIEQARTTFAEKQVRDWAQSVNGALVNNEEWVDLQFHEKLSYDLHVRALEVLKTMMVASGARPKSVHQLCQDEQSPPHGWRVFFSAPVARPAGKVIPLFPEEAT